MVALDTPDLAAAITGHREDDEAEEVARAIVADEAKLTELADMWDAGEIGRAEWMRLRAKVEARLDANRRLLARRSHTAALTPYTGQGGALRGAWPSLTLDQRRAVIQAVVDRVNVHPATVRGPKFDPSRVEVVWRV